MVFKRVFTVYRHKCQHYKTVNHHLSKVGACKHLQLLKNPSQFTTVTNKVIYFTRFHACLIFWALVIKRSIQMIYQSKYSDYSTEVQSLRKFDIQCLYSFSVSTFIGSTWLFVFSSQPQRPMTSDFAGFLYQILSITLFSYLNS